MLNAADGGLSDVAYHFEHLNSAQELVAVLVETDLYFLSVFSLLPEQVPPFGFGFEELVQVDCAGGES